MTTSPGIPIAALQAPFYTTGSGLAGNQPSQPMTGQAADLAAFRAGQAGFAQTAMEQLYPGPVDLQAQPPAPAGNVQSYNWISGHGGGAISPRAAQRGRPVALSWWQRRRLPGPGTTPQPVPVFGQSRPYDRGAGAYAPHFGLLSYNPIGAGVVANYRLPTIAGPGAIYNFGAIWWNAQVIPTSILINPTIPVETMDALIATSRVGASLLTTG